MKFEINKQQMQELVDFIPAPKIYDIFGKHEVTMLLNLKEPKSEEFDDDKVYILRIPNVMYVSKYYKLTKISDGIIVVPETRFTFVSLDNSKEFAYPPRPINELFEYVKSETDRELLVFDSFLEFTNFYVVNP